MSQNEIRISNRIAGVKPSGTEYVTDKFSIFVPFREELPVKVTGKGTNAELGEIIQVMLQHQRGMHS